MAAKKMFLRLHQPHVFQRSVNFLVCRLQYSSKICPNSIVSNCQRCGQMTGCGVRRTIHYAQSATRRQFSHHLQQAHYARRGEGANCMVRFISSQQQSGQRNSTWQKSANRNTVMYAIAIAITVTGLSYAAVPLYRIFCQASGYGGTVVKVDAGEKVEKMEAIRERELTIRFNADTSSALLWKFKPYQQEIKIVPGETALAFYTAQNPTDRPVTGIATYNVIPFDAGIYFNKIQCFCFEEQRLNPHEQVDMPVFFYIDPEFDDDPQMAKVRTITLSYTFFESKECDQLPQPLTAAT